MGSWETSREVGTLGRGGSERNKGEELGRRGEGSRVEERSGEDRGEELGGKGGGFGEWGEQEMGRTRKES